MNNEQPVLIFENNNNELVEVTHCVRCNRKAWVNPNEPYAFVPSTMCQDPPSSYTLNRQYANGASASTLDVPTHKAPSLLTNDDTQDVEEDDCSSSASASVSDSSLSLSLIYYNPQELAEYVANLPALPPLIPDKDQDKEDEKVKL